MNCIGGDWIKPVWLALVHNKPPSSALSCPLFFFILWEIYKQRKVGFLPSFFLTSQSHDYILKAVKRSHYSRTHAGSMLQIPLIPAKPHKRLKWDHRHVSAAARWVTQLRSPFWWLHQRPEVPPKAASIASGASDRFGEINDHEEHLVSLLTVI